MPPRGDHDREDDPGANRPLVARTDLARRVEEARSGPGGLIANLPGMVYQARLEKAWRMEFVSPGALEVTGYPASDFLADGPRAFGDLIHLDDQERVFHAVQAAVDADRAFSLEYRLHHADGQVRHVWDHGHPVFDAQGRLLCVEGLILDVSERVELAEQLRHAQRLETMGRLSGVVAHDFNNYLTAILGSLELADEDLPHGSPARESVTLALEAGRKARDLTRQLLLVSRSRPQKREVIDLRERVSELHRFLRQVVGSPVELRLETDEAAIPVLIDPVLVDQILLNLVVNAREALDGHGRVVVRAVPSSETQALLEVRDDGPGMDEATRERALDPFFTTKETGTGLGLATVQAIVAESGGTLELDSAPGRGCRCRITFPLVGAAEPGPTPAREGGALEGGDGQRVLVVDDDPAVLRLVTNVLRRFGYVPQGAADPQACRRLLADAETPPALVIMDVSLPGCSGITLADELRAGGLDCPVLFMSGYAREDVVSGAERLLDTLYLEKPFSVESLLKAVARSLDGGGRASEAG